MKSDYEKIFEQRGQSYDRAMVLYPNARNREFLNLFDKVELGRVQTLVDVPSGGGYLRRFLPDQCRLIEIEPCGEFLDSPTHAMTEMGLENLSLPSSSYDAIVCLAALHHVREKQRFFSECFQALNPGGVFLMGDVVEGSREALFLDDFAGAHNGTGHSGYYLSKHEAEDIAKECGFSVADLQIKQCPWVFDSNREMNDFCRLLFGLQSLSDDVLETELENRIGTQSNKKDVQLNWNLLYLTARKK